MNRDIKNDLSAETYKRGKTLFSFTNESLGAILEICKNGGSPEEALAAWNVNRVSREVGSIAFLPMSLMDWMIAEIQTSKEDQLLERWLEAGKTLGIFFKSSFTTFDAFLRFYEQMGLSLQGRRVRFTREANQDEYLFEGVYPRFSKAATTCMAYLNEGTLSAFSMKVVQRTLAEGVFILKVRKQT